MTSLAQVLKEGRKAKNWTLRYAADEVGISNGYLSLMETGRIKSPSPTFLNQIAESYGLSYAYLMELAGYPPSGPVPIMAAGATAGPQGLRAAAGRSARGRPDGDPAVDETSHGVATMRGRQGPRGTRAAGPGASPAQALVTELEQLSSEDLGRVRDFVSGLRAARR